MSDFQATLDDEISKRIDAADPRHRMRRHYFSAQFFITTFVFFLLAVSALGVWAWLNDDYVQESLKASLPSKTAVVRAIATTPNNVITMPPAVDVTPSTEETHTETTKTYTPQHGSVPVDTAKTNSNILQAPAPGLFETTADNFTLPIRRKKDGLSAFNAYKNPFTPITNKPLLSIVLYDVGLSEKRFYRLNNNMPNEVSFSLSPYSHNIQYLSDTAREKGREIWLTLPMETRDYPVTDPGPYTLLTELNLQQNTYRLHQILNSTQGYIGFLSQINHSFTDKTVEYSPYIKEIFERGLAIVDTYPYRDNFVKEYAAKNNFPYGGINFWLDEEMGPLALNQKIRQIIEFGEATGRVTVIARPYPASIKALEKFLQSSAIQKFELAPLSAQVKYGR